MSLLPLTPWVRTTRKVILWAGLCWPVYAVVSGLASGHSIIAMMFVATIVAIIVLPIVLAISLLLPTYKLRIFGLPLCFLSIYLLLGAEFSPSIFHKIYWLVSGGTSFSPYVLLWILPLTALGLLFPQMTSMARVLDPLFERWR